MREILFRGFRVDGNGWVYGDLITKPVHHDCVILENGVINYSVIPESVGQYTGKNDKNSLKIFEGDIVKRRFLTGVVVWYENAWRIKANDKHYSIMDSVNYITEKVIGNIHDNPELLNN